MQYNYVLFDLDGTLTDPKEGITKSVAYALKKLKNLDVDPDELTVFIGPPLGDSFKKYYGMSEDEATDAIRCYREYFSVNGLYENIPYESIGLLLDTLKNKVGMTLAVATSKPTKFAKIILEHFKLAHYFDCIVGSNLDNTRVGKDEVIAEVMRQLNIADTKEAIMIGDREHDVIGAKKMSMEAIGVLYGYGSVNELNKAGADYIIKDVNELMALFEKF